MHFQLPILMILNKDALTENNFFPLTKQALLILFFYSYTDADLAFHEVNKKIPK